MLNKRSGAFEVLMMSVALPVFLSFSIPMAVAYVVMVSLARKVEGQTVRLNPRTAYLGLIT